MNILNDLAKIPDGMYFKAIKTLEIIQVVLLNKESKKKYKDRKDFNNEKDIIVVAGDKDYINRFFSRDDIVKNFTNLNGTKIKLGGWHYNTKYKAAMSENATANVALEGWMGKQRGVSLNARFEWGF